MYAACCRYLYKSNSPGVQDYLCNRLYGLPEAGVERYLSQICQLVISRPFGSLERVLAALCASSLRIAVKVEMHSMISMPRDRACCRVHVADAASCIIQHAYQHSGNSCFLNGSAGVLAVVSNCAGSAQEQSCRGIA